MVTTIIFTDPDHTADPSWAALGFANRRRWDIPKGTIARFEPGGIRCDGSDGWTFFPWHRIDSVQGNSKITREVDL